jgi:hypothetical protein
MNMPIFNEKGKVFARYNILDLLIIAVILVLSLGGIYRISRANPTYSIKPKPIELKIIVYNREKNIVNMVKDGDILKEYDTGTVLGEIKKVEVKPATTEVITTEGEIKIAEIPDRYDLIITIDGEVMVNENSIVCGNSELRIGNDLSLRTKIYALNSTVLEIKIHDE